MQAYNSLIAKKKVKTINQATIIGNKDLVIEFLNNPKINKKYFKNSINNAIKYNKEEIFYLLFEFNQKNNIVEFSDIFYDLLANACSENNILYLKFLKENLPFKSLLIEHKLNKNFNCIKELLNTIIQKNSFEALQFLLTENNQIIQDCLNRNDSALTYKKTIRDLFANSCCCSKTSIVKYLFNFDIVNQYNDESFFYKTLKDSVIYNKLNTSKFIYKKLKLSNNQILELVKLSIEKTFYSFFKFLQKENTNLLLDNKKITNSLCIATNNLSKFNRVKSEKFIQFLEYLINKDISFNIEEISLYTDIDYVTESLNILSTKQKIQGF